MTSHTASPPQLVHTIAALRALLGPHRRLGHRIGFVPTMGFLHDGHASLMAEARRRADVVVVSIFVNPTQFGPNEDLAAYPRDLERDLATCAHAGVDVVFHPDVAEMYPAPGATVVHVPSLTTQLCGHSRPTHFAGVCTVVSKLFHIVQPDLAVFGQKDWQQLAVIRQMVRDLNFPIEIVAGPTVRDPDGLAMSSRNAYLSPDARTQALTISQSLFEARARFWSGERDAETLRETIAARLRALPMADLDYVEVVHPDTLAPITATIEDRATIAVACRIGGTRLIDNLLLDPAEAPGATP